MDTLYEFEVDELVDQICRKIQKTYKFEPHAIAIVMNGGYNIAVKIGQKLRVPHWYQFKFSKYDVDGNTLNEIPKLIESKGDFSRKRRSILVIDDVIETGQTVNLVYQRVKSMVPNEHTVRKVLPSGKIKVYREPIDPDTRLMVVSLFKRTKAQVKEITCPLFSAKTIKHDEWIKFYWEEENGQHVKRGVQSSVGRLIKTRQGSSSNKIQSGSK